ncbi:hypothetical protein Pcinc_040582 [Petrolisthes cinctipes]|uniref:Tuberin n=1 Tax=Petrolisthes cinctipes TaxID=88211 RepID=A0AAE1BLA0_PETCI|nr:hypothetical protein Pcinc_040582 [Petrolisthes cinctipes]
MSKDGRDNFAKKLREWFKVGGASSGVSNADTVPLTDEMCKELSKESPIETRLAAVQNLTQHVATKNIDREYGPETLWGLLNDLLSLSSHPQHRIIVLRLFIALSSGNRYLGLMRPIYFSYILDNFLQEDLDTMFDFFCNVMNHGRNIEYVEDTAPPLFIDWLPRLLDSSRTMQALDVVINMIKFNSPHLDSSSLHAIARQACKQLQEANCEEVAVKCLHLLDTMTAYSSFPRISLPIVTWILAFSVNAPSLVSLAHKVTKNLLGTDVGVSATMHMHDLILKSSDALVVRGAIFYLTHMVWGPFKIINLKQKTIQLIVALKEASENNNELVVYEITLGIHRLVTDESTSLSPSLWSIVITIVGNLCSHTKMMSTEAFAKQSILSVLQDIVVVLSELVEKKNYFGLPQQLYSLIEDYSEIQKEGPIMKLLEDKEKIITMTTNSEEWLHELCMVMRNYFTVDSRPKVKLAALDLFTKTYDYKRHMHGAEITKKIVPTYMGQVDKEGNVSLKIAIVRQLVKMALQEHGNEAMEIVHILEKLVLAPYTKDEKGPLTIDDVYDVEKAVDSLILLFKCKMWEAPITLSVYIYYILLSCLEQHYKEPELLFRAVSIRYQIFEMVFEMRINSNYQVGFPRIHHSSCEGKSMDIDDLLSPYSPYLILAHTDNIKLSETDKQLYRREALIFGHSPTKESHTFKNVTEEKLLAEYSSMETDILKDKESKIEEHNTAQDIKGNEDKVDKSEIRDNEENVERQRIAEDMPEKDEESAADKHEQGAIPKKRITSPKRPNTETNGKGVIPKRCKVNSPKNTSISKEVTEDIESAIPKSLTEQLQSPDDPARRDTEEKNTTLPADSTDKSCTGTYRPETHTQQTKEASNSQVSKPTLLSLSTTATIILQALKEETDWIVLRQILKGLPHAIVNKIFLLTDDGREIEELALYLCRMVTDRSLNLPNYLLNTSQNFTWSDFQTYVYPVLASLASHHMYLRHSVQMQVVRSLQLGVINRVAGGVCLMALTVCVVEMSAMVKEMHNVISHFSTITPTPHISRPMMEFLSCVLHFPSLHRNFVPEQYKAVFALAIPYTNPLKFNHYIVSLAYHVVAMWFLKCQMKNKVHIADYIIKSLNGILIDIRRHFKEQKIKPPPKPTSPWKRAKPVKVVDDSDEKLQFYIDQQETLMDLMFQNMITSFPVHAKRDCIGEMLMAEGTSKRWLIGNKVITITTSGCPQRVLKHALSRRDTAGAEAGLGKAQSNEPSISDSVVESLTPSQATASSEVFDTGDVCDSIIVPELRHPPLKQFSKEDGLSGEFMSMVITEHQQEPRPVSDPLPQRGSDYESIIDSSREKQSSKRKPARPASAQEGGHHITEEHTQNKMLRKDDMLPLQFQEKISKEATTSNEGKLIVPTA